MPPPIETEIKIPLPTEAAYQALRRALRSPDRARLQHNLFFDTADHRLGQARWGLRLRKETDPEGQEAPQALAALKGPARRAHGATVRVDLELPVEVALWEHAAGAKAIDPGDLPAPITQLLRQRALPEDVCSLPLRIQFTNLRSDYDVELAGTRRVLLVDRTEFVTGQVGFEVEVEVEVHATPDDPEGRVELTWLRRDLLALLARCGIRDVPPAPGGKLSRALRYASV